MLQKIISQNSSYPISDMEGLRVVLEANESSNFVNNFLFFRPYLASDFPEVTCDKTYFFLYSSDHDASGGTFYGRCCWGKGNNLDLTDFEPLGVVKEGLQAETPFLLRLGTTLYFYYHVVFDRGISVETEQETRCMTTTGGLLHTATWTDTTPINVLGEDLPQDHTGYLKIWDIDGVLKGTHYKLQSLPGFITGQSQVSTTINGVDWVRGLELDMDSFADSDRFIFHSYGEYFKKFGQWWWVGTDQAKTGSSLTSATRGVILCKCGSDLDITEQITRLNNGDLAVESWHPYYDGSNTLHIYAGNINTGELKYSTYDLNQLENYL